MALMICSLAMILSVSAQTPKLPAEFKPTDESFKQYQYPEWFRDAKFGIWAHWGYRLFHVRETGTPRKCIKTRLGTGVKMPSAINRMNITLTI